MVDYLLPWGITWLILTISFVRKRKPLLYVLPINKTQLNSQSTMKNISEK